MTTGKEGPESGGDAKGRMRRQSTLEEYFGPFHYLREMFKTEKEGVEDPSMSPGAPPKVSRSLTRSIDYLSRTHGLTDIPSLEGRTGRTVGST